MIAKVLQDADDRRRAGDWDDMFTLVQHDRNGQEYETKLRPSTIVDADDCPTTERTWRTLKVMGNDMIVQNAPLGRASRIAWVMTQASAHSGGRRE